MQSLAGWAITRSDQEIYRKLLDVLAEIIPMLPESIDVDIPETKKPTAKLKMRDELPLPELYGDSVLADYYNAVRQGYTPVATTEGCRHKFDIKTQRCVHCHKSYLEIRSRKPECF